MAATESLRISNAREELDMDMMHRFMSRELSWARDMPRATLEAALENSLCFGAYLGQNQVGFARVVTDYATFGYLADVFVLPEHRGKGYSVRIVEAVDAHPRLQGLRRFMLATSDAHGLYTKFGFAAPQFPHSLMERYVPDIYSRLAAAGQPN